MTNNIGRAVTPMGHESGPGYGGVAAIGRPGAEDGVESAGTAAGAAGGRNAAVSVEPQGVAELHHAADVASAA